MEHDFSHLPFRPADILLPQNCDLSLWSVVACDQYTSQPEYWQRVEERVGRAPSALRLILPESSLDGPHVETDIMDVNNTMTHYLREDRFALLPHAMVYVERTLDNGRVRRGLVGMVDLEQYDYEPGLPRPRPGHGRSGTVPHPTPGCSAEERPHRAAPCHVAVRRSRPHPHRAPGWAEGADGAAV